MHNIINIQEIDVTNIYLTSSLNYEYIQIFTSFQSQQWLRRKPFFINRLTFPCAVFMFN